AAAAARDRSDRLRNPALEPARGGLNSQGTGAARGLGWPGPAPPRHRAPHPHSAPAAQCGSPPSPPARFPYGQGTRMTLAARPRRLSRLAAAAAATILLMAGCT